MKEWKKNKTKNYVWKREKNRKDRTWIMKEIKSNKSEEKENRYKFEKR